MHFVPSFILFTWHGLWGGNRNAKLPLVLFWGLTWLFSFSGSFYSPPEGSFYERSLIWGSARTDVPKWQLRSINFPVSNNSTESWLSSDTVTSVSFLRMSGFQSTNTCLDFLCVQCLLIVLDDCTLCRGPHLMKCSPLLSVQDLVHFVPNKKMKRQQVLPLWESEKFLELAASQFWFLF